MRRLAGHMQQTHPDMTTAQHIRDAARVLESGNEEAAQRHLRAAAFTLSPQSLMRHGMHTDDAHISARESMHGVHRHLLLVKDIEDAAEKNQAAINRDSYGDNPANLPPRPQPQPDPNAGYGPGALAQKPTARQPPGNQALNAPARTSSGGSDPNVADPVGPQPRGSKQFARTWDELARVIDMTGDGHGHHIAGTPYEWEHGYIPLTPAAATSHFRGKPPKGWTAPSPKGSGKTGTAATGSPEDAATAHGIAANVRLERGLSRFQREEAEQRLHSAAEHLNAGDHAKAASELDEAMRAASMRGGGVIKGSTAAQARDLRNKIRAGHPAGGILSGPHPADKMTVTTDKHAAAQSLSDDELGAANKELSRRAALLGKPGQLSKGQKAVQAEMKRRGVSMSVTWDDLAKVIELVGPKGYIHGWIFVGIPVPGDKVFHPRHGLGTVTDTGGGRVSVSFDKGHSADFPIREGGGPARFEHMTDDELVAEHGRSTGSRANAVVAELDRRDQRDREAKAERVSSLYAEKPKTEADRNRVYQGLVNEGEDPEEAWAHAHGAGDEDMRKQAAIQDLRSQGYQGGGFDALTRAAYKDDVRRRTVMAENATNGYMLSPKGKQAGIDPYSLFTGPQSRARKYASPELKEWFDQNGRPTAADFQAQLVGRKAGMKPADFYASVTWDDVGAVIELSARTATLEVTPAPYGKPGGPGLYDVKGLEHTPYFQNVVQALMAKRGMDKGRASAIAYGALRKWSRGGGNVHPEVRAAAAGALAGEKAAGAIAKAAHGHAVTWDDLGAVVELATVLDFYNPAGNPGQARVPTGQVHAGQFTKGQSQQQSKGKHAAKGRPAAKGKPDAHQKHVAHVQHVQHVQHNAKMKAGLLATAKNDRAKASALIKQRAVLRKALASASGKTSSGQSGSTTAANATTASSAPATAAAAASTSSPGSTAGGSAASGSSSKVNAAQVSAQITALNTQIGALLKSAAQAQVQASKL